MKNKRRDVFFVCSWLIIAVLFSGCKKQTNSIDIQNTKREAYARTYTAMADSWKEGIYIQTLNAIPDLFYLDRQTGKIVFLCGKADCDHGKDGNIDCNAYFQEGIIQDSVQIANGKLYVLGRPTKDRNSILYQMDLDGSNREAVTEFHAEAGANATRIIDKTMYSIGMPYEGDFSAQHIYRQDLENKDAPAEDIFPMKDDTKEWASRIINEMFIDAEKKILYFTENCYTEDLTYEGSVWKYDITSGEFEKIFTDSKFYTYFVDGDYVYYSEYTAGTNDEGIQPPELTTFSPVEKWNYRTKKIEEVNMPGGFLCGYDGKYCYMKRYQDVAWAGVKSIDVYTLEGELVESIEATVDDYQEYSGVNIGTTYDAIVMHHMRLDKPQTYISEDIYVYDKAMIGTGEGTWRKVAIDSWFNEKTYKNEIKITQEK